jgi:hypothetical protein
VGSGDGEAATGGGAKECFDGGGTPMAPSGGSGLLQQQGRGGRGVVRPDRAKGPAWVELTEMPEGSGGRIGNAVKGGGGPVTGTDERLR